MKQEEKDPNVSQWLKLSVSIQMLEIKINKSFS